jgi:hypothetical protein
VVSDEDRVLLALSDEIFAPHQGSIQQRREVPKGKSAAIRNEKLFLSRKLLLRAKFNVL